MDNQKNYFQGEIDILEFLFVLRKNILLITIVVILITSIGIGVTRYVIPKKYNANTTLIIQTQTNNNAIDINDIRVSQQLSNTYTEIIKSKRVLKKVIENLYLNESVNSLRKTISVNSVSDTEILNITVTSLEPETSYQTANMIANVFMEEVVEIMSIDNVQIIDEADLEETAVSPNLTLNVVISFILGLLISMVIIIIKHFLDNTVKSKRDLENMLGINVVGLVQDYDINDIIKNVNKSVS